MTKGRIDIISLGCSKNLIDSERLMRRLEAKGYKVAHDSESPEGEYVVVNTCGFIADAKTESIEMLLTLSEAKKNGIIGKIVVIGCLSERYMNELKEEMPEIDIWYGKFNWKEFVESLPDKKCSRESEVSSKPADWERTLTTPPWSAYLKISEGCNRFCAFCAIPLITGRHTSRPVEEILSEVTQLVSEGVKEFNIIAQDLSSYGLDISGKHLLPELIDRMAMIPEVEWIRLHYAYPSDFPMEILDVMNRHSNVCKYIDIALQHISDPVLNNMRRHISREETLNLIREMRGRVPDLKIRTTLMVGFPGEGDAEFDELMDFVKEMRFDRMGAFAYSEEEGTWGAEHLDDNISDEVKEERLERLMKLQEDIAFDLNEEMIGKKVRVLIDRIEGDTAVGRTQWDSPEVDPEIFVKGFGDSKPGDFIEVEITASDYYDLLGKRI